MGENIGLTLTVDGKAILGPVTGELQKVTNEILEITKAFAKLGSSAFQTGGPNVEALQSRLGGVFKADTSSVKYTPTGVNVSGITREAVPSISGQPSLAFLPPAKISATASIATSAQEVAMQEKILSLKQRLIVAGYTEATVRSKINATEGLSEKNLSNYINHQNTLASAFKTRAATLQQINLLEARNPVIAQQYAKELKNVSTMTSAQQRQLADNMKLTLAASQASKDWSGQLRSVGFAFQRVGSEMKQLGTIGLAAVGKLIQESMKYNLIVVQMSQGLKIPIQDIGKLGYIADATGVPIEALSKGIGNYWQSLLRAGQGTSMIAARVREALDKVGISAMRLGEVSGMSTVQMLGNMRKAFQELKEPQDKAYVGQMVFGQAYEQLIPLLSMSNEQWTKMGNTFDRLFPNFGKDAEAMQQQIYDINGVFATWRLTMRMVGSELLINLKGALDTVTEGINKLVTWMNNLSPSTKAAMANLILFGPLLMIVGGYFLQMVGNIVSVVASFAVFKVEWLKLVGYLSANPWIIITALIIGAGIAIYKLVTAQSVLQTAFNDASKAGLEQASNTDSLVMSYSKLALNTNRTVAESEMLKQVSKELISLNPDLAGVVDGTASSVEKLAVWWGKAKDEMVKYAVQSGMKAEIEKVGVLMANQVQIMIDKEKILGPLQEARKKRWGEDSQPSKWEQNIKGEVDKATKEYNRLQGVIEDVRTGMANLNIATPEVKPPDMSKPTAGMQDYVTKVNKILSKGLIKDDTVSEVQAGYDKIDEATRSFYMSQEDAWSKNAVKQEEFKAAFAEFIATGKKGWETYIDDPRWKKTYIDVTSLVNERALKQKQQVVENFIKKTGDALDKSKLTSLDKQIDSALGKGNETSANKLFKESLDAREKMWNEQYDMEEKAINETKILNAAGVVDVAATAKVKDSLQSELNDRLKQHKQDTVDLTATYNEKVKAGEKKFVDDTKAIFAELEKLMGMDPLERFFKKMEETVITWQAKLKFGAFKDLITGISNIFSNISIETGSLKTKFLESIDNIWKDIVAKIAASKFREKVAQLMSTQGSVSLRQISDIAGQVGQGAEDFYKEGRDQIRSEASAGWDTGASRNTRLGNQDYKNGLTFDANGLKNAGIDQYVPSPTIPNIGTYNEGSLQNNFYGYGTDETIKLITEVYDRKEAMKKVKLENYRKEN